MKPRLISSTLICASALGLAAATVNSPDAKLVVTTDLVGGRPVYSVTYDGKPILLQSPLGFETNIGDFSKGLTLKGEKTDMVKKSFDQDRIKKSHVDYTANRLVSEYSNEKGQKMSIEWLVSDNDIAFPYLHPHFPDSAERRHDRMEAHQALLRGAI